MKPIDDLRGSYNQFVRSEAGKDFLTQLATQETYLTAQAYAESEHQKKAQAIDKAAGIYWVRTLLSDLAKPKAEPKVDTRKKKT